jgi:hypothetical protein
VGVTNVGDVEMILIRKKKTQDRDKRDKESVKESVKEVQGTHQQQQTFLKELEILNELATQS